MKGWLGWPGRGESRLAEATPKPALVLGPCLARRFGCPCACAHGRIEPYEAGQGFREPFLAASAHFGLQTV